MVGVEEEGQKPSMRRERGREEDEGLKEGDGEGGE